MTTTPRLDLRHLRADAAAALTVWAVLVPESLAYATIAGVPPVVGLYAAVPSLVLYALLGGSRVLVVAPMSATAALSAGVVQARAGTEVDVAALTAALALTTGAVALVAGLLRLGFVSSFISEPVLKGFVIGLALTIVIGQLPDLLGLEERTTGGGAFREVAAAVGGLPSAHVPTLGVGVGSLALVLGLRRWLPRVPGALVAVVLGIVAATAGLADLGVPVVGAIEPGLPPVGVPAVPVAEYVGLLAPAAGVALVGFVEGLGAAKAYTGPGGLGPDRELRALGAANVGAALVSGMVVNGSLSKTAVNAAGGARTQVSNLMVAALTVLTLGFLTGLFASLPHATLAAVVVAAVVDLVDVRALRRLAGVWTSRLGRFYGRAARADLLGALAALVGVLVLDVLAGLLVGVVVSVLLLLHRASHPHVAPLVRHVAEDGRSLWVERREDEPEDPHRPVRVVRVEGGLFFANAEAVRSRLTAAVAQPGARALVVDVSTSPTLDVTAAAMLASVGETFAADGVELLLAHGTGQVRDVIATSSPSLLDRVHPDVDTAVAAASAL